MMHELRNLRERAKELQCLYRVHEIVSRRSQTPAHTFIRVLETIPAGWQRPESTGARIAYLGRHYVGPGFSSSDHAIAEPICLDQVEVGRIEVSDTAIGRIDSASFLDEERELLRNIAHRLGDYLEWKHTELLGDRATPGSVHWRWRDGYAEALAGALDAARFGVSAVYLGGSTEAGQAGPGSDIDLLIVFHGTEAQRAHLTHWLEGWSLCLGELALQQTGCGFVNGILNIQWTAQAPDLRHRPDLRPLRLAHARADEVSGDGPANRAT